MRGPLALLVTLAAALAACGDAVGPETVTGTYTLKAVDGEAVPVRVIDNPSISIVAREVVLGPGGSFTDRYELRVQVEGSFVPLPVERAGSYDGGPGAVTLTYASGRRMRAFLEGPVLELDDRGVIFLLRRP